MAFLRGWKEQKPLAIITASHPAANQSSQRRKRNGDQPATPPHRDSKPMMSTNTKGETERSPGGVRSHRQRVRLTAEYLNTTGLQSQRKNDENLRHREPGRKGNKLY